MAAERALADLIETGTDLSLVADAVCDAARADKLVAPERLASYLDPVAARRKSDGRSLASDLFDLAGYGTNWASRWQVRDPRTSMAEWSSNVKFGVVFPHEIIGDADDISRYAVMLDSSGLDYLTAYDHVLGADTSTRPDWTGSHTSDDNFHEILTLFSFIAGLTKRLELVSGVLVLPQRQTALVAKQAAELDVLLRGRLRLGVGVGWNEVEYAALGEAFAARGERFEEQIAVLRSLWCEEIVTYHGKFHELDRVGIRPLPLQRPIPIWLGGAGIGTVEQSRRVLSRIGRLADGWIARRASVELLADSMKIIRQSAEQAGRDPAAIGLQVAAGAANQGDIDAISESLDAWTAIGATHVSLRVLGHEHDLNGHLDVVRNFAEMAKRVRDPS
jgi:probable F420-dependent oxidoreductase